MGKFVAFPTVGGLHYRLPDGSWRYTPGAKASLLVIGSPSKDKDLLIVESSWDALALHEATGSPVVCTRGASNERLAIEYVDALSGGSSMSLVAVPQNDPPGEKWLQGLRVGLMLHDIQVKRVPPPFKDYAQLHAHHNGVKSP